jgi:hypothetical protein
MSKNKAKATPATSPNVTREGKYSIAALSALTANQSLQPRSVTGSDTQERTDMLVEAVKESGRINYPLFVGRIAGVDGLLIGDGFNRFKVAQLLGITHVPILDFGTFENEDQFRAFMAEEGVRAAETSAKWTTAEKMAIARRLLAQGKTQAQVAVKLRLKDQTSISQLMALERLPKAIIGKIDSGEIKQTTATKLAKRVAVPRTLPSGRVVYESAAENPILPEEVEKAVAEAQAEVETDPETHELPEVTAAAVEKKLATIVENRPKDAPAIKPVNVSAAELKRREEEAKAAAKAKREREAAAKRPTIQQVIEALDKAAKLAKSEPELFADLTPEQMIDDLRDALADWNATSLEWMGDPPAVEDEEEEDSDE